MRAFHIRRSGGGRRLRMSDSTNLTSLRRAIRPQIEQRHIDMPDAEERLQRIYQLLMRATRRVQVTH